MMGPSSGGTLSNSSSRELFDTVGASHLTFLGPAHAVSKKVRRKVKMGVVIFLAIPKIQIQTTAQ